jgi:hypothetical protein
MDSLVTEINLLCLGEIIYFTYALLLHKVRHELLLSKRVQLAIHFNRGQIE